MSCSSCGFEITTGAKFCAVCGARQALSCPSCGTADADVHEAIERARIVLDGLGAAAMLRRLDALVADDPTRDRHAAGHPTSTERSLRVDV